MYKYKQTTDVEIGDLVIWTNPSIPSRIIKNKPYRVTDTRGTLVAIQDELGSTICYSNTSRKTLETKPADQAVVGDYMYRITSGPDVFPQHTIIKITKLSGKYLNYNTILSVRHDEVIVIAQAEPEIKYPYFTESKQKGKEYICKVLEKEKYIYIYNWVKNGCNKIWNIQPPLGEPCDFTTEPEVFDIDWWQQRFEAGLPVYATDYFSGTYLCGATGPQKWLNADNNTTFSMTDPSLTQKVPMSKEDIELFKQQMPLSSLHLGLCNEISLGATADCSLQPTIPLCTVSTCEMSVTDVKYFTYKKEQKPIQKEKPMTFQDFINSLFTEEIKTDYEKKPNFLVTIYNSEGTEIAVTTATSVKSVENTLQSTPKLWGSKAVMYSIDSEVQVSVPVVTTKFKKPKEEK